jgi:TP901 family phage tail tape measure protein
MFDVGALIFRIQAAGTAVFAREMDEADRSFQKVGKAAKSTKTDVDDAGKASDKTGESFRRNRPKIREFGTELAGLSDEGQRAAREIGGSLVLAGGALIAMTGLAVKAAVDWESAWAGVTKTVDGNTQQMGELEGQLRSLTGVLPASHEEIAAVAEAAGQLGVQRENVAAFTRTMIDLGETTNLSATEAATSLARFMNVMGTAQSDVSRLGSAVVELGNNYATTEAEIVAMATRLSGAGRQIGLSEGEVLGLATSLSSVGIEAEAGGTAVSKVMIEISAAVEKGGDDVQKFASVAGVSAEEFAEKWRSDPGAALAMFVQGLANAEEQGQSTFAVIESLGIVEQRMRDALLRSAAASDQFTDAMQQGNSAFEENVALQSEAEKRYETTAAQLQVMSNNVRDAAIDFGSVFLPVLKEVSGAVSEVAGFVGDLPDPVKETTAVLGLAAGAAAVFGGALLLGIPKVVEFRAAQATLAREMPKTTAAMRGVTGFLFGPWGLAFAAGVAAISSFAAAQAESQARTDAYADTLEEGSNRITAATREMVQEQLAAKRSADLLGFSLGELPSIYDRVEDLQRRGVAVSTELVTDAALGQVEAMRELKSIFDEARSSFTGTQDEYEELDSWIRVVTESVAGQSGSIEEAIRVQEQIAGATDETTASTRDSADAFDETTSVVETLQGGLEELTETIRNYGEQQFDVEQATLDFQQSLADLDEALAEGQGSLDATTEAGRTTRGSMLDVAQATNDYAASVAAMGGSTEEVQGILDAGRQKLIDTRISLGDTEEAAKAYADQLVATPEAVQTQVELNGVAAAEAALADLTRRRTAIIQTQFGQAMGLGNVPQAPAGIRLDQADGGTIEFYAGGGVRENHVAQFARAGDWRVWAEPETGGEAYIPLTPSKRPRSTAVLADVADRFGYDLIPRGAARYADGATTAAPTSAAGDTFHITMPALPEPDADRVVREFVDEVKWLKSR